MKKIRPIKNTWYDWLINYIPQLIRKSIIALKDKIASLYKSTTLELFKGEGKNSANHNANYQIVFHIGRKQRKN